MRKTKIVCTLGPASDSSAMMSQLLAAGMDVARVNMSHGTQAGHAKVIRRLRAAARAQGRRIAVLLDLQGPKIRVGRIAGGKVQLLPGHGLTLTDRLCEGTAERVFTQYKGLPQDVKAGDQILLDDGKLRLRVESVKGGDVRTVVVQGGWLSSNKGMNLPGVSLSTPSVTAKDLSDLRFGLQAGVDYVALSFVRHADDVARVKKLIQRAGHKVPVIAKIEKPEALEHLRAICRATDGIMVARGDLGVELDLEKVPMAQKEIISQANLHGCMVITATQMLESMTEFATPTRAEASDVANAILDGTDAVMLSGETAAGKHPVEAAATMARLCVSTEGSAEYRRLNGMSDRAHPGGYRSVSDAVCYAARAATEDLRIRALVCFSQGGDTARLLSKTRPEVPIYMFSPLKQTLDSAGLLWGVEAHRAVRARNLDALFKMACSHLKRSKRVNQGDTVILVSGTPLGHSGSTNMLKIHKVE